MQGIVVGSRHVWAREWRHHSAIGLSLRRMALSLSTLICTDRRLYVPLSLRTVYWSGSMSSEHGQWKVICAWAGGEPGDTARKH